MQRKISDIQALSSPKDQKRFQNGAILSNDYEDWIDFQKRVLKK